MGKNVGFKFYTNYLGEECEVTRYWTDKHWWFYSKKHGREFKAGTRLSYFKGQEDEKARAQQKLDKEKVEFFEKELFRMCDTSLNIIGAMASKQELDMTAKFEDSMTQLKAFTKQEKDEKPVYRTKEEKRIDEFVQKHYGYKESAKETREIAKIIYEEYESGKVMYALEHNLDLYDLDRWELVTRIKDLKCLQEKMAQDGFYIEEDRIKKAFLNFDNFVDILVDPLYAMDIEIMEYSSQCDKKTISDKVKKEKDLSELIKGVTNRTVKN